MLSANFKPKTTVAASRSFLAIAQLSYIYLFTIVWDIEPEAVSLRTLNHVNSTASLQGT